MHNEKYSKRKSLESLALLFLLFTYTVASHRILNHGPGLQHAKLWSTIAHMDSMIVKVFSNLNDLIA